MAIARALSPQDVQSQAGVSRRGPVEVGERRRARLGHAAQHGIDQSRRTAPARVRAPARPRSPPRHGSASPAAAAPPLRAAARGAPVRAAPCAGTARAPRPAFPSGEAPQRRADARPHDPVAPEREARPAPPRAADGDPALRSADRTPPHVSGPPSARGGTAGHLAAVQPAARQHLVGRAHRPCRSSPGSRDAGPRSRSPGSPVSRRIFIPSMAIPGLIGCVMASLVSPPSPTTSCAGRDGPKS